LTNAADDPAAAVRLFAQHPNPTVSTTPKAQIGPRTAIANSVDLALLELVEQWHDQNRLQRNQRNRVSPRAN
jgi:hypothetical protein